MGGIWAMRQGYYEFILERRNAQKVELGQTKGPYLPRERAPLCFTACVLWEKLRRWRRGRRSHGNRLRLGYQRIGRRFDPVERGLIRSG